MNKIILIGNLTKDTDLTTTANGTSVCKFGLAVNRDKEEADFFNIVVFGDLGVSCSKYLSKGKKCAITGKIQTRSYNDKDGNKKYITEVLAESVEFLSKAESTNEG